MNKIILIDGNNLLYRSYFATAHSNNKLFSESAQMYVNGVNTLASMLLSIIDKEKPTHIAVCFDKGKSTFRHEMYSEYKAGRSETPDELKQQISIARELCEALNVIWFEDDTYEADDIIASLADKFHKEPDTNIYVYTSDHDLLQLVRSNIFVSLIVKGVSDIHILDAQGVYEKKKVWPKQIVALKAIMGDKSDNIPGIKGIGEAGAIKLLEEYKDIRTIFEKADEIPGALGNKIRGGKEEARLSYDLARLRRIPDMRLELEDIASKPLNQNTLKFFKKYDMKKHYLTSEKLIKKEG